MEEVLSELIRLVQSGAPELWEIGRRQLAARMAEMCTWAILLYGATFGLVRLGKWAHSKAQAGSYHHDEWMFGMVMSYLVGTVCFLVAVGLTSGLVLRFVNPDYYILHLLASLVVRRGN